MQMKAMGRDTKDPQSQLNAYFRTSTSVPGICFTFFSRICALIFLKNKTFLLLIWVFPALLLLLKCNYSIFSVLLVCH